MAGGDGPGDEVAINKHFCKLITVTPFFNVVPIYSTLQIYTVATPSTLTTQSKLIKGFCPLKNKPLIIWMTTWSVRKIDQNFVFYGRVEHFKVKKIGFCFKYDTFRRFCMRKSVYPVVNCVPQRNNACTVRNPHFKKKSHSNIYN